MSSVMTNSFKQTNGYFVALSTVTIAQQLKVNVAQSGAGGDFKPAQLVAYTTEPGVANLAANTLLKDMGKTVVSSSRVFRKVQAIVAGPPGLIATVPVTGVAFYIEMATDVSRAGAPAVAYLPGLF